LLIRNSVETKLLKDILKKEYEEDEQEEKDLWG
jgi:hypothetical protein